jgi:hypothetical protein
MICAALLLPLTACKTKPKKSAAAPVNPYENHLLLNTPAPYDKLLVEIDSVEGLGPSQLELDALQAFLQRHCNKPGGITLQVDPAIPRAEAQGVSPTTLALGHLTGPPDDRTAFLYILFYDSRIEGQRGRPANPHYSFFPYPAAIYINRAYHMPGNFGRVGWEINSFTHEAGHALGLSLNPAHSRDGHCTNKLCQMRAQIGYNPFRVVLFRNLWKNTELCADCTKDLTAARTATPPANLGFHGKYFLRTEPGYVVLTLPGFMYVHLGPANTISRADLTKKHASALFGRQKEKVNSLQYASSTFDLEDHIPALKLLSQEKVDAIHELTEKIFTFAAEASAESLKTDAKEARSLLTDELIDAAAEYPEVQKRLKELQAKLPPQKKSNQ